MHHCFNISTKLSYSREEQTSELYTINSFPDTMAGLGAISIPHMTVLTEFGRSLSQLVLFAENTLKLWVKLYLQKHRSLILDGCTTFSSSALLPELSFVRNSSASFLIMREVYLFFLKKCFQKFDSVPCLLNLTMLCLFESASFYHTVYFQEATESYLFVHLGRLNFTEIC